MYNNVDFGSSIWLDYVKRCLDEIGLSYIWITQGVFEKGQSKWFKHLVNERIRDKFITE